MIKDLLLVVAHKNTSEDIQVINLINVIYGKEFSTSCSLQTHIRTHTGINLINEIYRTCMW